jgi:hypothetical protein
LPPTVGGSPKKLAGAVRALYGGTRDVQSEDEALAAFGLKRDGPEPEDAFYEVWPENWQAVVLFSAITTQWNVGMNGPVGLRYESLPFVLELHGVAREEWPEVFVQIRACESEALKIFAEKRQ